MYAAGTHAPFVTGSYAASPERDYEGKPPGAAGGFYLDLAVPATPGDRDGTRADADAAEGRDAEQEQAAGGRTAVARAKRGFEPRAGN